MTVLASFLKYWGSPYVYRATADPISRWSRGPLIGNSPISNAYMRIPNVHQSAEWSYSCPYNTSGAINNSMVLYSVTAQHNTMQNSAIQYRKIQLITPLECLTLLQCIELNGPAIAKRNNSTQSLIKTVYVVGKLEKYNHSLALNSRFVRRLPNCPNTYHWWPLAA